MIDAETVAEIIIANAYIEFQHGVPCICYKNGDRRYVRVDAILKRATKTYGLLGCNGYMIALTLKEYKRLSGGEKHDL